MGGSKKLPKMRILGKNLPNIISGAEICLKLGEFLPKEHFKWKDRPN